MSAEEVTYAPVQHHWLYCQQVDSKDSWIPFSLTDSKRLEDAFGQVGKNGLDMEEEVVVATDGRRYDVRLRERRRYAVYWEQVPSEVRRCSWFHRGDKDTSYTPYAEDLSLLLEEAYMISATLNTWMRRLEFPDGEIVVMHSSTNMLHHKQTLFKDGQTQISASERGRTVKRGLEDILMEVPEGEADKVHHLVIMVHGIGPACDIQMRGIVQCVNDFRSISLDLLNTHFKQSQDLGRVEFLPVNWHRVLHGNATGVDNDIQKITLPSISRLRQFSNSTVLDLFFYNSPTYCQTITDTVGLEINSLHRLFLHRHPGFTGAVSLAGHSLGSLILFDLLTNQENIHTDQQMFGSSRAQASTSSPTETGSLPSESLDETLKSNGLGDYIDTLKMEHLDYESLACCSELDLAEIGIPLGPRKKIMCITRRRRVAELEARRGRTLPLPVRPSGKAETDSQAHTPSTLSDACATSVVDKHFDICIGQAPIVYPQLAFQPQAFFAFGSPIGMFLTVRGLKQINPNYSLPTCKSFYNIYHPFDPVAYRIEPLVVSAGVQLAPMLIPHYKGRKRMHLELKDSFARVGSDLLLSLGTLRNAWQTLTQIPLTSLHQEERWGTQGKPEESEGVVAHDSAVSPSSPTELQEQRNIQVGMLNGGRRFDYVLQEKPIESFNEYLFAIQSHLCYWESQDTALLVLKEIYEGTAVILKNNQEI